MKESRERVKFCPKCGSTNVNFAVFYRPSIWRCLDCGYEGAFIAEGGELTESTLEKLSQRMKELDIAVPKFSDPTFAMPSTG
jgi:DNA-directed RNA polymerase subunit M